MQENQSLFSLSIDPVTKSHLNDTVRWTRFLAIAGMVLLAFALLLSFLTATIWSNNSAFRFTTFNGREAQEMTTAMRIGYLIAMIIVMCIAFFPLMYLLQFANRLKRALAANEQKELNEAFLNLKKYFRYLGIILIIALAFYILIFVLVIIFGTMS